VLRERVGDGTAVVGGPVVDQDDLEVVDGLRGDRRQAVAEIVLDVVDRHDDADAGHGPRHGVPGYPLRLVATTSC
jgi:hypothetical protein